MKPDEVQSAPSLAAEYNYDTDEEAIRDDKDQKIMKLERRVKELEAKVTDLQKKLDAKQSTQDESISEDEKALMRAPYKRNRRGFRHIVHNLHKQWDFWINNNRTNI